MKKLASFVKVSLLVAVVAVFGFTALPSVLEADEVWIICPYGPADCAIGTVDGRLTTWEVGAIIIFPN